MSGESSTEERSLPPTRKKLQEARKKGRVATSRAFLSAIGTVVIIGYLMLRGDHLATLSDSLFDDAASMTNADWQRAYPVLLRRAFWGAMGFLLPILILVPSSIVIASLISNRGVVFSTEPLVPKPSRLSPAAGIQRIFSQRNLMTMIELLVKFLAITIASLAILGYSMHPLLQLPECGAGCMPRFAHKFFGSFLIYISIVFVGLGVIDIAVQRFVFWREMHMTRSERRRERKESEGSLAARQVRKQAQQSSFISNVRLGLHNAALVIYGEEIAVAMAYSMANAPVPTLVARALQADDVVTLVETARTLGLPCVLNSGVAAQLANKLQLGDTIPKPLFGPVIECMKRAGLL